MAALTSTNLSNGGAVTATVNTLTSSDTFNFSNSPQQRMVLRNATGGSLTVNLDGANATTFEIDGFGTVDPTSGLDIVVANGATAAITLVSRNRYLGGEVTVTGGTGIECIILEG